MKLAEIKSTIRKSACIETFNPMQVAVAATDARRLILLSPTGSGKTIAFALAIFRRLREGVPDEGVQAVIVAPSRELVRQIYDVIRPAAAVFGLKTTAVYGGNDFGNEENSLRGPVPSIIVATPGRLLDHINRGSVDVSRVENVVLDEYDKILELGFHDEMRKIVKHVGCGLRDHAPRFVMVTSATALKEMPSFVDMESAEVIDFSTEGKVESRLRIVNVPSYERDKLSVLAALVRDIAKKGPVIVFVNHRESADRVGEYLDRMHISAVVYHGGLDQQHREMALASFDSRAAAVLVCTDLAARGIDIEGVSSVVHYHPAVDETIWKHRNGRTARVDRTGDVYVITGPEESVPEFVKTDNDYYPDMTSEKAVEPEMTAIYFNRGKRDKISRGDIAGFVMKQAGVPAASVGRITLGEAYSLVAVKPEFASKIIEASRISKLKGQRVRASLL